MNKFMFTSATSLIFLCFSLHLQLRILIFSAHKVVCSTFFDFILKKSGITIKNKDQVMNQTMYRHTRRSKHSLHVRLLVHCWFHSEGSAGMTEDVSIKPAASDCQHAFNAAKLCAMRTETTLSTRSNLVVHFVREQICAISSFHDPFLELLWLKPHIDGKGYCSKCWQ